MFNEKVYIDIFQELIKIILSKKDLASFELLPCQKEFLKKLKKEYEEWKDSIDRKQSIL